MNQVKGNLMNNITADVRQELERLNLELSSGHIKTGELRKYSSKLYRNIKDKSKENIFNICEELLEHHNWAMGLIAYDFAYRVRKQYDEDTFDIFEKWLEKYVRGWGDCDDFCTHAFGELILQKPHLVSRVILWTKRDEFWMRRASAVILILSIQKDKYNETKPLLISDRLMTDENDLVRKGYGWMLKVLSIKEPDLIFDYLVKYKDVMPRVSFRYAVDKMDKERRNYLMKL
jgi:3-methyladenine DNA glycosylase AlkD